MSSYRPTIGLEVHAELKTRTKMFCACANLSDEKNPNTHICPICMAHPGTLPVINEEAVEKVLLIGASLGASLADYTEFDRKNYFYPDIPKGYQISQYAYPLVKGGTLNGIAITRVHLEEDTARSQHEGGKSVVDYNRAGVPLMELVTEPVIHTAEDAGSFARELQMLLRYLGAGEANMEKGEMRIEANISVSATDTFGTKVEVKNLNSFRSVERAIRYEIERQIATLDAGGTIAQETRGWDEGKQQTFSQRKKESSEDYRYFPEPDIPKLKLSEIPRFAPGSLKKRLPLLPWERREMYLRRGLKPDDAEMFTQDRLSGDFFDAAARQLTDERSLLAANYVSSDLAGMRQRGEIAAEWFATQENASRFAKLMNMIAEGKLSSRGAKDTLNRMTQSEADPALIAKEHGLLQQNDEAFLDEVIKAVLAEYPAVVSEYRGGKESALQFLVGQGMKRSKGAANPQLLQDKIKIALR